MKVVSFPLWQRCLLALPIAAWAVVSSIVEVYARPASVFTPHLQDNSDSLALWSGDALTCCHSTEWCL
ncbi:MAG: hypothetical protein KME06_14360 [Kastovskya adunca ATA6-11-RM4]|nr:hypothetical protein [Kastovskya adunca ATA6-11-RM4]